MTGAVTGTRSYDAFGVAQGATAPGTFGYKGGWGYQEDKDTGFRLLGHRYYDADTGRFLTRDPIKDGRNWYGYGGEEGSPTTLADPTGLAVATMLSAPTGQMALRLGPKGWIATGVAVGAVYIWASWERSTALTRPGKPELAIPRLVPGAGPTLSAPWEGKNNPFGDKPVTEDPPKGWTRGPDGGYKPPKNHKKWRDWRLWPDFEHGGEHGPHWDLTLPRWPKIRIPLGKPFRGR